MLFPKVCNYRLIAPPILATESPRRFSSITNASRKWNLTTVEQLILDKTSNTPTTFQLPPIINNIFQPHQKSSWSTLQNPNPMCNIFSSTRNRLKTMTSILQTREWKKLDRKTKPNQIKRKWFAMKTYRYQVVFGSPTQWFKGSPSGDLLEFVKLILPIVRQ